MSEVRISSVLYIEGHARPRVLWMVDSGWWMVLGSLLYAEVAAFIRLLMFFRE